MPEGVGDRLLFGLTLLVTPKEDDQHVHGVAHPNGQQEGGEDLGRQPDRRPRGRHQAERGDEREDDDQ